jgi:hypothetical protein
MMPVKGIYKPDHEEFQRFILSEQARQPAVEVANDIVKRLRVTVKRSNGTGGADGHLADSFKVNENSAPVTLGENPRVGAEVYSDHPAAAAEEFGGKRNKPRHWLRKAGNKYHVPLRMQR